MGPVVVLASESEKVRREWRLGIQEKFATYEVTRRAALVRTLATQEPAVLLLDLDAHRLGGVTSLPMIQRASPRTAIVLLTSTPDDREGILALKLGAGGYGRKDVPPRLLRRAVERIQQGEIWAGRRIVSTVLGELIAATARRRKESSDQLGRSLDCLSPRQREIARLVGNGDRNRDIAKRLNITERAVKAQLTVIFRKLGLSHRLQLALIVAQRGPLREAWVPREMAPKLVDRLTRLTARPADE